MPIGDPTPPAPYAPIGYNPAAPVGLGSLLQGVAEGVKSGMGLMQMKNEADYRNALLSERMPVDVARANELNSVAGKNEAPHPLAGTPLDVPGLQPGTVAVSDGKGGVKVIQPKTAGPGGGPGGVLASRQEAASKLIDNIESMLPKVNLPTNDALGRPTSWLDEAKAYALSSSPEGQLQGLVKSMAPTLASAVSNRVNEAEIERQSHELESELFSRSPAANRELLERIRGIITPQKAGGPLATTPLGAGMRITVKNAQGQIGHIPANQLQDAIKQGYTQVQ